jgi:N-acetylglucosamine-6-phosphate deacetylase
MNLVTHLYSCTSTITRDHGFRRLGVIETAYLEDDLYIEIICDGKHLPPELIRMILKCKDNDKIALITDSMEIAGTSEKIRTLAGRQFIVEDGVCKLMDRSAFAGSIATADVLIRTLTKECDVPVPAAVKMLTKVPAEILQVNKGELKVGRDADVVVFDEDINIRQVFLAGQKVC